ncbi:hypothetical protein F4692_000482 [Nocardioides cavernae]|uniref:HIRAN domain-containing protein n=1 Tax=Nocardioides cavernae TaxID=1921566 RepID=A0A7Y9GZY5_9ACTN|nr:hypothetical protein [Nocardioides cavernae]NYE35378.1 hypothetical protein [Nocardioides cavernae]
MTSLVMPAPAERPLRAITRLLVTVRDPHDRRYRPVGFLTDEDRGYCFSYLEREVGRDDFRPLPGMARAVEGPVHSQTLFPLFAERVISSRRPDRQTSLEALGLTADAAPFEVLLRSHGQRVGDTVELLPAPYAAQGDDVSFTFLTHGVRHLPQENQNRITGLTHGEPLHLVAEHSNPVNPKAQVVTDTEQVTLGWMPDPLLEIVEQVDNQRLVVERANPPNVGFHFRLLARLTGQVSRGRELFAGDAWRTVAPRD